MSTPTRSIGYILKTTLCVGLTLNLHVWSSGCGSSALPSPDGFVRIALPADHALSQATRGTAFGEAKAIEVNPTTRQFRVVLPDGDRAIEGSFAYYNGRPQVSTVRLVSGGQFVELEIDDHKHITSATLPGGQLWIPSEPPQAAGALGTSGVDGYVSANQELVNAARGRDGTTPGGGGPSGGGGSGSTSGAKSIALAQNSVAPIQVFLAQLSVVMAIVLYWPLLFTTFLVLAGIDLALSLLNPGGSGGSGGGGSGGGGNSSGIVADATLRVRNNLTTVPVWYVVLFEVPAANLPGGNLLGEQAIPTGESQDFAVPPGTRTFNIVAPNGSRCLIIYNRKDVRLTSSKVTELIVSDSDLGELYPIDCQ